MGLRMQSFMLRCVAGNLNWSGFSGRWLGLLLGLISLLNYIAFCVFVLVCLAVLNSDKGVSQNDFIVGWSAGFARLLSWESSLSSLVDCCICSSCWIASARFFNNSDTTSARVFDIVFDGIGVWRIAAFNIHFYFLSIGGRIPTQTSAAWGCVTAMFITVAIHYAVLWNLAFLAFPMSPSTSAM